MTKADLLKYIDERLTQRSDGNIGLLMVRQYVEDNMKTGKWIGRHERGVFSHPDSITYECSECGCSIYTIYWMPRLTNFCPKCGAEMKGEEE